MSLVVTVEFIIDREKGYQYRDGDGALVSSEEYVELLTEGLAGVLRMWGVEDATAMSFESDDDVTDAKMDT